MRQSEIVESFKLELKHYPHIINRIIDIEVKIDQNETEIDRLEYEMTGVKGLDPSKERGGYMSPEQKEERRSKLSDSIDELKKENEELKVKMNHYKVRKEMIDDTLNRLPEDVKKIVIDIYVNKRSYDYYERKLYLGRHALFSRINRELEEIL